MAMNFLKRPFKNPVTARCVTLYTQLDQLRARKGEKKERKGSNGDDAKADVEAKKLTTGIEQNLEKLRASLYGTDDKSPKIENIQKLKEDLVKKKHELFKSDFVEGSDDTSLLIRLLEDLSLMTLKSQKEVVKIITFFLVRGRQNGIAVYFAENSRILDIVLEGSSRPNIAVHCAPIVRECIVHKDLAKIYLDTTTPEKFVPRFFKNVQVPDADVASNAFSILRSLLTTHSKVSRGFFAENYDAVFQGYFLDMLQCENYVTQVKALELLHDILLDRKNQDLLFKFLGDLENLKLIMGMLRIKKVMLQFAVFNVFKLFVANTKKTPQIASILIKNREPLRNFLTKLTRDEDRDFDADKQYLMSCLDNLEDFLEKKPFPSPPKDSEISQTRERIEASITGEQKAYDSDVDTPPESPAKAPEADPAKEVEELALPSSIPASDSSAPQSSSCTDSLDEPSVPAAAAAPEGAKEDASAEAVSAAESGDLAPAEDASASATDAAE